MGFNTEKKSKDMQLRLVTVDDKLNDIYVRLTDQPVIKAKIAELYKKKATIDELCLLENDCASTYLTKRNFDLFLERLKQT